MVKAQATSAAVRMVGTVRASCLALSALEFVRCPSLVPSAFLSSKSPAAVDVPFGSQDDSPPQPPDRPSSAKIAVGCGSKNVFVCYQACSLLGGSSSSGSGSTSGGGSSSGGAGSSHSGKSSMRWVGLPCKDGVHRSSVVAVAWHPSSLLLATASTDGRCRILSAYVAEVDDALSPTPTADPTPPLSNSHHTSGSGGLPAGSPSPPCPTSRPQPHSTASLLGPFGSVLMCVAAPGHDSSSWVNGLGWSPAGRDLMFCCHNGGVSVVAGVQLGAGKAMKKGITLLEAVAPASSAGGSAPMRQLLVLSSTAAVAMGWDGLLRVMHRGQEEDGRWRCDTAGKCPPTPLPQLQPRPDWAARRPATQPPPPVDAGGTQRPPSQMWPLPEGDHPFGAWETQDACQASLAPQGPAPESAGESHSDSATLSRFGSSLSDGGVVHTRGGQPELDLLANPGKGWNGLQPLSSPLPRLEGGLSASAPVNVQPYMHESITGSDTPSSETLVLKDVDCFPDQFMKSLSLGYASAGQPQSSFARRTHTQPEPMWTPANLAATLAALRKAGAVNVLPSNHAEAPHTPPGSNPMPRVSMLHEQRFALPYPAPNALNQQLSYPPGPVPDMGQSVLSKDHRAGSSSGSAFEEASGHAIRAMHPQQGQAPVLMDAAGLRSGSLAQLQSDAGMGVGAGKYMPGTNPVRQGSAGFGTAPSTAALQQQLQMQQQQAMLQQRAMAQHQQHVVMQQQQHHALSQQQLLQQHTLMQQQQQEQQRLMQQQEQQHSTMQHQLQSISPIPGGLVSGGNSNSGGMPSVSPLHLRAAAVERAPWVAGFAPVVNKFDNPACNTLFIGNLGDSVDEGELSLLLSLQPGFKQIKLVRNPRQVSCFVEFTGIEDAVAVHAALQGVLLHSSDRGPIRIQFSKNPFGQRCPPSLASAPGPMTVSSTGMRSFFHEASLQSQSNSRQHSESNSSWGITSGAHSTISNQWDQLPGAGSASTDAWLDGAAGGYLMPSSTSVQQRVQQQQHARAPPATPGASSHAGGGALYGSHNTARDYSSYAREDEPHGMRRVGSVSDGQFFAKTQALADFMPWQPSAGAVQQRTASPLPGAMSGGWGGQHGGWGGQQQQSRLAPSGGSGVGMLNEQHQQMLLQQQHSAHQQQLGRSAMSALLQHGPAATAISSQALLSALSWGHAGGAGWMSGNPDVLR
ncbi:MAG: hypothetical protein WDW36_001973 [Sanguina aurantia]